MPAVIDAHAMAGTLGAPARGLQSFRPELPWVGTLAKWVAIDRHAGRLNVALRDPSQWMGAVPRGADVTLPERPPGLDASDEMGRAMARLEAVADGLAETPLGPLPIDRLPQANFAFEPPEPTEASARLLEGRTIALGARFFFYRWQVTHRRPAMRSDGRTAIRSRMLKRWPIATTRARRMPCGACRRAASPSKNAVPVSGNNLSIWVARELRFLRGHAFHCSTRDTTLWPVAHRARPAVDPAAHARAEKTVCVQASVCASHLHARFASTAVATARLFSDAPIEAAHE